METKYKTYDYKESFRRIDEILDGSDKSFEELKTIPSRNNLTYTNGFYVKSSAIFVTLRDPVGLSTKFPLPLLAKIYRCFISETVAILNSNNTCVDIRITGDCVSAIYDTPHKTDIDGMFSDAARINSLIKTLNYKLAERAINKKLTVGIGMDYGQSLMVKAGYSGSGINDVLWIGGVVNRASQLCRYANKHNGLESTFVAYKVFVNLSDYNKKLLKKHSVHNCYFGDVINVTMDEWNERQSAKSKPRRNAKTNTRKK
jgi:class 3 adenylate cyclase